MIKVFVFLGNPGREYERTRHNAAFMLAEHLYPNAKYGMKFHSKYLERDGVKILLPMTMMNRSGTAVSEAFSFYHLKAEEILVFHDDTELPAGVVKLEEGGPLRGHNGLRDIALRIGSSGFPRMRIGIGRPPHGDMRLYVTSPFSRSETELLGSAFIEAERLISDILTGNRL